MYRVDSGSYDFITIEWDSLSKTQYNSYFLLWCQLNEFADVQKGQATSNKYGDRYITILIIKNDIVFEDTLYTMRGLFIVTYMMITDSIK